MTLAISQAVCLMAPRSRGQTCDGIAPRRYRSTRRMPGPFQSTVPDVGVFRSSSNQNLAIRGPSHQSLLIVCSANDKDSLLHDTSSGLLAALRNAGRNLALGLMLCVSLTGSANAIGIPPPLNGIEAAAIANAPMRDLKPAALGFLGDPVASKKADLAGLDLSSEEVLTINLFDNNKDSVVNITNVGLRRNSMSMAVEQVPRGTGSGFIWDDKGHIVTNFHVIQGASNLRVTLIDQSSYAAKVVGAEPDKDVAVLEIDAPANVINSLKPITVGKSSRLLVGQRVYAIGNPFGLDHTLTSGIISGLGREIDAPSGRTIRGVVQTDAAINPGNSGGVLLDSKGRLIGINTAIADPTGTGSNSGVGFAIPIDAAKGLVDQILQYGQVMRPSLGVVIAPSQLTRQLGAEGVLILDIQRGGPADKAGLQATYRDDYGRIILGDIITEMKGIPIKDDNALFDTLDSCKVGETISVKVLRNGKDTKLVTLTLGNRSKQLEQGLD